MVIYETSFKDDMELMFNLDEKIYPDFFNNDNSEWYHERYRGNETMVACDYEERKVGYIAALPITKELYDTIIEGVLDGDFDIASKMYLDESNYYYLSSVIVDENFRGIGIASELVKKLLEILDDKKICVLANNASKNIFINNGFVPTIQNKKYCAMFKE